MFNAFCITGIWFCNCAGWKLFVCWQRFDVASGLIMCLVSVPGWYCAQCAWQLVCRARCACASLESSIHRGVGAPPGASNAGPARHRCALRSEEIVVAATSGDLVSLWTVNFLRARTTDGWARAEWGRWWWWWWWWWQWWEELGTLGSIIWGPPLLQQSQLLSWAQVIMPPGLTFALAQNIAESQLLYNQSKLMEIRFHKFGLKAYFQPE